MTELSLSMVAARLFRGGGNIQESRIVLISKERNEASNLHDKAERKKQKAFGLSNFLEINFLKQKTEHCGKPQTPLYWKTFGGNIPNVNRAGFSVTKMHQWSFYSSICSVFSIPYLGAKKPSFFKWFFFFHNDHVIRYRNFESLCCSPRTNTVL